MKGFVDAKGRNWSISLTLASALRVRDELKIDLLQPESGDPPLITRLGTDEFLLAEVIRCLLGDQLGAVTDGDLQDSFDGRTLFDAQVAFYDELVDFFQSRGRLDRAKAVAAQKKMIALVTDAAAKKIDSIDLNKLTDGVMSGQSPEQSG